jgi:hypothetical protein
MILHYPAMSLPEYKAMLLTWEQMYDTFRGQLNKLPNPEKYLPRESNEPADAYPARLKRSPYENHTKKIITSYAGAISGVAFDGDLPEALKAIKDDIDLKGHSIEAFLDRLDVLALRDKFCFALVDFYSTAPETRADEIQNPSRPFWRSIDPRQAINYDEDCGAVERITIAEQWETDNNYGKTTEKVYRCINGAAWEVLRLVESEGLDEKGRKLWRAEPVTDEDGELQAGVYLDDGGEPLDRCPIIPYALTTGDWADDELPAFIGLSDLNIALYQAMSDWFAQVHSLCPVPWIIADDTAKLKNSAGQLSIGPHDFLDLGSTGTNACGYLQANPEAVKPAYDLVQDIRYSIKQIAIGINSDSSRQLTVVQTRALLLDVQQDLNRYAKQKESVVNNLMLLTGKLLGIEPEAIPKAQVSSDISMLFSDEKSIDFLYRGRLISLESALARLNQLGFNEDVAKELLRLRSTQSEAEQALNLSIP